MKANFKLMNSTYAAHHQSCRDLTGFYAIREQGILQAAQEEVLNMHIGSRSPDSATGGQDAVQTWIKVRSCHVSAFTAQKQVLAEAAKCWKGNVSAWLEREVSLSIFSPLIGLLVQQTIVGLQVFANLCKDVCL